MELLRRLRKERGLTQAQVAEAVGTDRSTYAHIEIGRTTPSLALAFRIASFFQCDIHQLFGGSFLHNTESPEVA